MQITCWPLLLYSRTAAEVVGPLKLSAMVESRMGAVAWGLRPAPISTWRTDCRFACQRTGQGKVPGRAPIFGGKVWKTPKTVLAVPATHFRANHGEPQIPGDEDMWPVSRPLLGESINLGKTNPRHGTKRSLSIDSHNAAYDEWDYSRAWRPRMRVFWAEGAQAMTACKIVDYTSTGMYSADYRVEVAGRVYEAHLEDPPGEHRVVHIDGLDSDETDRHTELYRSIEGVVLADWLGIDALAD